MALSVSLSQTTPPMMTASQKALVRVSVSSKKTGPRSAAPTAPIPAHTAYPMPTSIFFSATLRKNKVKRKKTIATIDQTGFVKPSLPLTLRA